MAVHVFATPETLIGFHTDAGASFHLSHLPGYWGEYLALMGEKLNEPEMIACGLATHYAPSAKLPLIEERLGKLVTDDPSVIEASLEQYGSLIYPDNSGVLQRIETLDKCFSRGTVEEIIDAFDMTISESPSTKILERSSALASFKSSSKTEVSLTFVNACTNVPTWSIREGRFQTFDQCLVHEYRMSVQGFYGQISNDFREGVRARMVEKDYAPKRNPPSLEQVSNDMVDQYFFTY
uniref:3-hydroxyisobutyryl-CoA hydrolase n=1 Tax=Vitis vinifera TaxID=29760 RepID=A5C6E4_VITVI|nr:hypothetical protein VITISV_032322 [Vitis vinifera]